MNFKQWSMEDLPKDEWYFFIHPPGEQWEGRGVAYDSFFRAARDLRVIQRHEPDPNDSRIQFLWLKHDGDYRYPPDSELYDGTVLYRIPKDWYDMINSGHIQIVIDTSEESWGPEYKDHLCYTESANLHHRLEFVANELGINPNSITWLTGDMNAEEYCKASKVNVKSLCQFFFSFPNIVHFANLHTHKFFHTGEHVENFMIFPNRFPKAHRAYVLQRLEQVMEVTKGQHPNAFTHFKSSFPKQLHGATIIDAFCELRYRKNNFPEHFDKNNLIDFDEMAITMADLHCRLPYQIDDVDFNTNSCAKIDAIWNIKDYYQKSAFALVSETWAEGNKLFLSDAVMMSILHCTPFLLIAGKGSLKFLRDNGFKTFGSIIDESYDDIQDDVERWEAIVQEVKRLSNSSVDDWRKWRKELQDVVAHNFDHMFEYANIEERKLSEWISSFTLKS
jgi:hypothetical protein